MKVFLYYYECLNACLHELCHVVMAVLLYPFGTRLISGAILEGGSSDTHSPYMQVSSAHKSPITVILVSAAPLLFYWVVMISLLLSDNLIIYFALVPSMRFFFLSKSDLANIRKGFKKTWVSKIYGFLTTEKPDQYDEVIKTLNEKL